MTNDNSQVALIGCVAFALLMVFGGSCLMTPADLRPSPSVNAPSRLGPPPPPRSQQTATTYEPPKPLKPYEPTPIPKYEPPKYEPPRPLEPYEVEAKSDDESESDVTPSMSSLLADSDSLDYSDCTRQPPRTWTSADGSKTVEAGFWGADHVRRSVLLKVPGHKPREYSWDRFSDDDQAYLMSQCEQAAMARKTEQRRQAVISRQRLQKRAAGIAKANARSMLTWSSIEAKLRASCKTKKG